MDYTQTATNGNNALSNLEAINNSMRNMAFDMIWSGKAQVNLVGKLTNLLSQADAEKSKLNSYFGALNDLELYKQNKENINSLSAKLYFIPDDEKHSGERSAIISQIQELKNKNAELKSKIESVMSSINSIGSAVNLVSYDVNFNYITDVNELLNRYDYTLTAEEKAAGQTFLNQLKGGQSLASYYNFVDENGNTIEGSGYQYIINVMTSVQNSYSGREAAVNSALAMLKLASDKNVKLDYVHKGTSGQNPYVRTSDVITGVDCNPWTSYCVDKGTPNGFQWRPVTGFYGVGENLTDWTKAQPGDVFVNSGHVGIIIENDPANNRFVVAEAKGQEVGIVLNERSYNNLKSGGYSIRDMTNVYAGTENTNRSAFDEYIDMSNYERTSI